MGLSRKSSHPAFFAGGGGGGVTNYTGLLQVTSKERRSRPVQLPLPTLPLLPHQFAPLGGTEKGVGLELVDTASSSAQAPRRIKLQQLWRKPSGLGRPLSLRYGLTSGGVRWPVTTPSCPAHGTPSGTLGTLAVSGHQHVQICCPH